MVSEHGPWEEPSRELARGLGVVALGTLTVDMALPRELEGIPVPLPQVLAFPAALPQMTIYLRRHLLMAHLLLLGMGQCLVRQGEKDRNNRGNNARKLLSSMNSPDNLLQNIASRLVRKLLENVHASIHENAHENARKNNRENSREKLLESNPESLHMMSTRKCRKKVLERFLKRRLQRKLQRNR